MLANAKYIYALDMWTVEKRPNGWYFSKSAYHGDKHNWRGPCCRGGALSWPPPEPLGE